MNNEQLEEIMKNAQRVQEQLEKSGALKAVERINSDSSIMNAVEKMQELKENGIFDSISQENIEYLSSVSQKILESIGEKAIDLFSKISQSIADAVVKNISNISPIFTESFSKYISDLGKSLKKINLPQFSEEQKNIYIEIHKQWGSYGWTDIRLVPINMLGKIENQEEADKLMLSINTDEVLEKCFSEIKEKKYHIQDIDEAISCYVSGFYKASAMLLFSVIDSYFINKQDKNKENIKPGKSAIEKYERKTKKEIENIFSLYFRYISLFTALEMFFDKTDNFRKETLNVNRNMILHGMGTRPVCKTDCIKLFFVLKSLLYFEEEFSKIYTLNENR
jgi:hypothetical protein